jgi:putative oxidoreductase
MIRSSPRASATAPVAARDVHAPRGLWQRLAATLDAAIGPDLLALAARLAIAGIFWASGRTKVEGWLTVTDEAVALFRDEYRLPLLPPAQAAHLAAWAEHLFPAMLVAGLGTRAAALALLAMTATIQFLVYPSAWATHLCWATLLALLAARGGGRWSADRAFGIA